MDRQSRNSYSAGQNVSRKMTNPASPSVSIGSRLAPSPHIQRPQVNPNQNAFQHSYSTPIPPIHTANAPNPYAQNNAPYPPYGPYHPPAPQPPGSSAQTRYMPQRPPAGPLGNNIRPVSRDGVGGGRSPSRANWGPVPPGQMPPGQMPPQRPAKRDDKKSQTKKNLTEGATKGLLGAGAIAGFLEALEGLSI